MYRIEIERSLEYTAEVCKSFGFDPTDLNLENIKNFVCDIKDASKVLIELQRLLDLCSDGKVTSIKITHQ